MSLRDIKEAERMRAQRELDIAAALADPETKAALDTLVEKGVGAGVAYGCLLHIHRQLKNQNP